MSVGRRDSERASPTGASGTSLSVDLADAFRASQDVIDDEEDSFSDAGVGRWLVEGCSGSCLKRSKNFWISGSTGSFGAADCSVGGVGAAFSSVGGFEDDDQSQPIMFNSLVGGRWR